MRRLYLSAAALLCLSPGLHAAIYSVTNTNDSGAGSFRQALTDANANSGLDTIRFSLSGSPPFAITPLSALPAIIDPVVIDGTSQPGFPGRPLIALVGNKAGTNVDGLVILAGGSAVQGLAVNQFGGYGIVIEGIGGNTIQGNFIGVDVTGTLNSPNGQAAVGILASPNNLIGGLTAGTRNLISGRNRAGVYIAGPDATGNQLLGNLIGTDITGSIALGNASNGVLIAEAPLNVVGGAVLAARNIIAANGESGIYIIGAGAFSNVVQGNFIGTDLAGAHSLGNLSDGVTIYNASSNLIGGTVAGARNVISGNHQYGVYLGSNATANVIQGNFIGTDGSGSNSIGNAFSGVGLEAAAGNLLGGTSPGAGNLVSGNIQSGVRLFNGASNNVLQGNFVGTGVSGSRNLSNGFDGVTIESAQATVGGAEPGAGNVISGNSLFGVYISNSLPGNSVQGNSIGTDASGRSALGNQQGGVGIYSAAGNTIGGTNLGAGNLISANGIVGLYITNSPGNVVQGNFIGTGVSGSESLANGSIGLFLGGSQSNLIGGTLPGARNLVVNHNHSFNDNGLYLFASSNNKIQGNFIGADASGSLPLGNFTGVLIDSGSSNLVGGASLGSGNLISGNADSAVHISGSAALGNIVQGNFIGTTPDGNTRLDNLRHGVQIDLASSFNVIGGLGPNEGNLIAYNVISGYDGVRIQPINGSQPIGNLIAGNSIFGHTGLGIDLETDGVTLNDTGDADKGANNVQNFPVISLASNAPGRTVIQGTLNSERNKTYRIELFANPACDAAGYGEGQIFLGALSATTDGSGNTAFTNTVPWAVAAGYAISATATDPANNTSEFSACRAVTGGAISADLRVTATVVPNPATLGNNVTWQITIQNLGPNPAFNVKLIDTLSPGLTFVSANPGPATRFGNTFIFNLGVLSNGMSLTVSIVSIPTLSGSLTNLALVTSGVPDPSSANNSAATALLVPGPTLSIVRSNDSVILSWPASTQAFQLEAADDLLPSSWSSVQQSPVLSGNRETVTVSISGPRSFYRLRAP